jgi:hypothetical protein
MEYEVVEVSTRDEYQGAQEPLSFVWQGRLFRIAEVADRWYEGRFDSTRMPLRYYKVVTTEGERYILRYHEFFRVWSILASERRSSL